MYPFRVTETSVAIQTSIRAALEWGVEQLACVSDTARLDAEVMLGYVLNQPRHQPYVWPGTPLEPVCQEQFQRLVKRRAAGEPIAYLTGRREFWSLDLEVTPDTLIPRPETECLVEIALTAIPNQARWRIADLGTGSGALALALASERPDCRVVATDISSAALAVAKRNAQRLGISNVVFRKGDWCQALPQEYHQLIVSNPPYVAATDPHLTRGDIRFEPLTALMAGPDGLAAIRRIIHELSSYLAPGGRIILEHGFDQALQVCTLLRELGFSGVKCHRDHAGHERIIEAIRLD